MLTTEEQDRLEATDWAPRIVDDDAACIAVDLERWPHEDYRRTYTLDLLYADVSAGRI